MGNKLALAVLAGAAAAIATPAAAAAEIRGDIHGGIDRASADGVHRSDGLFGAALGFDVTTPDGHAAAGLEADADYASTKECLNTGTALSSVCVKSGLDLSLVGRLGYKAAPGTLVYILGGYSRAQVRTTVTAAGSRTRVSDHLDGARFGAGLQLDLGRALYAKLEYRYTNYESGFDRHQGLVGLGFRF